MSQPNASEHATNGASSINNDQQPTTVHQLIRDR